MQRKTTLSGNEDHEQFPQKVLVEADLFISYLTADNLEKHFRILVERAEKAAVELWCSSEVYDDIAISMRTDGMSVDECSKFLADVEFIPHKSAPMTAEIASQALALYSKFGGRRRLHYFDAFHVSTAKALQLPFYTSDKYIINNSKSFGIKVVDVRTLAPLKA